MDKKQFDLYLSEHEQGVKQIQLDASSLHASVGQTYDGSLPYSYHLFMVATAAMQFGYEIVPDESYILPLIFSAYFHDSIEDARQTYNDVMAVAHKYMSASQAYIAAEVVYALTNDKGRTRAERAGERYYKGIRETPLAPFVKLCDRYANMSYSFRGTNSANLHMRNVYQKEWNHFKTSITVDSVDSLYQLPTELIYEIENLML